LQDFLYTCPVLPANVSIEDLLHLAASKEDPDGIILTENGTYKAVLFGRQLLQLFGMNHLEMQLRMVQLQKMEAIGALAGGLAHDLNNLLTPIAGFAEMALEMVEDGETPDTGILKDIHSCAMRAAETVKRVQSFSRHQTTERTVVHLFAVIEEALRIMQSSIPKTLSLKVLRGTSEDSILGNAGEILQVVMNLCTNAVHAMKGKCGDIIVRLSRYTGHLPGWHLCKEKLEGNYVCLSVTDSGCGIPREILPQVFMPFFTTKKQGEGTGMGLAVSHAIVNRGGGHISIESEVDQGSTFHVVWPLHGKVSAPAEPNIVPDAEAATSAVRALRAVVVDDEPSITRLATAILSRRGYDVVPFTDSLEAIHAIENDHLEYDVLIVDQMMPNLTGIELARRALKVYPNAPIVMCTGYTHAVSPEEAKKVGIRKFMLKPVNFNKVIEGIELMPTVAC